MHRAARAATLAGDNEEVPAMNGVVLVAYASKHGSTREIAERICEAIQATGLRAHLRSAAGADTSGALATMGLGNNPATLSIL